MLTVLHAGGKFGQSGSAYSATGGLHGVGLSVVNALSSQLEVKVRRNGMEYTQSYSRGLPQGAVVEGERQRARGRQPKGRVSLNSFLVGTRLRKNGGALEGNSLLCLK